MIAVQGFALDGRTRFSYYAVVLAAVVLAGCGGPGRLAPASLPPLEAERVVGWVGSSVPAVPLRYDLRWFYSTNEGSARGRAAVRFVPPDSVRFDFRAPFGRSGAAVVVGDSMIWAEPEEGVGELVRVSPLFWGLLGVARPPGPGAVVEGFERDGVRLWQYVDGSDTLAYRTDRVQEDRRLQVELRTAGTQVGRVETRFAGEAEYPYQGTVRFPAGPAVFQLTVQAVDTLTTVDATIWQKQ